MRPGQQGKGPAGEHDDERDARGLLQRLERQMVVGEPPARSLLAHLRSFAASGSGG